MTQNCHESKVESGEPCDEAWRATGTVVTHLCELLESVGAPLATVARETEAHTVGMIERTQRIQQLVTSLCEAHGAQVPPALRAEFTALLASAQYQDVVSQRLGRLKRAIDELQAVSARASGLVQERSPEVMAEAGEFGAVVNRYLAEEQRHAAPQEHAGGTAVNGARPPRPRRAITLF